MYALALRPIDSELMVTDTVSGALREAGYTTYEQLSALSVHTMRHVLAGAGNANVDGALDQLKRGLARLGLWLNESITLEDAIVPLSECERREHHEPASFTAT